MRRIGIIILIVIAFSSAQTGIMLIHRIDGTIDSIDCSRMDPATGITFSNNNIKMNVAVMDMDPFQGIYIKSTLSFCTSQIDSITFSIPEDSPPELAPVPDLFQK